MEKQLKLLLLLTLKSTFQFQTHNLECINSQTTETQKCKIVCVIYRKKSCRKHISWSVHWEHCKIYNQNICSELLFFYRVCCPPSRSMLNENDKKSRQQKQNPSMNTVGTMRIQGQNFFFVSGQFHLWLFAISQVSKMEKLFQWFKLQSKIDGVFNSRILWYVLMNILCFSMAICTNINLTCFRK